MDLLKLREERNSLLVRLISVTDDTLKEQLHDEYQEAELKLASLEALNEENERIRFFDNMQMEFTKEYEKKYTIITNLSDAIKSYDNSVYEELNNYCERNKCRDIDRSSKRHLCLLLNSNGYYISLRDIENVEFDYIGNGGRCIPINYYFLVRNSYFCQHTHKLCKKICIID